MQLEIAAPMKAGHATGRFPQFGQAFGGQFRLKSERKVRVRGGYDIRGPGFGGHPKHSQTGFAVAGAVVEAVEDMRVNVDQRDGRPVSK
ncbi:MAG: hypothetical protein AAB654_21000, partial [Acidobacteriota bacterium]